MGGGDDGGGGVCMARAPSSDQWTMPLLLFPSLPSAAFASPVHSGTSGQQSKDKAGSSGSEGK